jgi:hypothetical protein
MIHITLRESGEMLRVAWVSDGADMIETEIETKI